MTLWECVITLFIVASAPLVGLYLYDLILERTKEEKEESR